MDPDQSRLGQHITESGPDQNEISYGGQNSRDEALSAFVTVTGASKNAALEALDKSQWNLERAINSHLETLPCSSRDQAVVQPRRDPQQEPRQSSVAAGLGGNVIDLGEDTLDETSNRMDGISQASGQAPISGDVREAQSNRCDGPIQIDDENSNEADRIDIEDQMLKQALEESMQTAHNSGVNDPMTPGAGVESSVIGMASGPQSSVITDKGKSCMGSDEARGASPLEQHQESEVMNESPHVSHNLPRANSYGSMNVADKPMAENEEVILPDDVNTEEAKMLEAAMFGIPYQGHIPSSSNARDTISSSIGADPEMVAQRRLRIEQERAYQASLKADQEKEVSRQKIEVESRHRIQEEEQRQMQEMQRQEEHQRLLQTKKAELPAEPSDGENENTVSVMIRLPDGSKLSRKFLLSHKIQFVFHFVDIYTDLMPNSYRLLTQFPRRVLDQDSTFTLYEAGLTSKQEALFVELL